MNFMISLVGWFLWNWAEFSITKEESENGSKRVSFGEYARTHYETWIGSFVCIFVLLWVGYRQMRLDPFEVVVGAKIGWNDAYLLASGFVWDLIIFTFRKGKSFFKKKTSEL